MFEYTTPTVNIRISQNLLWTRKNTTLLSVRKASDIYVLRTVWMWECLALYCAVHVSLTVLLSKWHTATVSYCKRHETYHWICVLSLQSCNKTWALFCTPKITTFSWYRKKNQIMVCTRLQTSWMQHSSITILEMASSILCVCEHFIVCKFFLVRLLTVVLYVNAEGHLCFFFIAKSFKVNRALGNQSRKKEAMYVC